MYNIQVTTGEVLAIICTFFGHRDAPECVRPCLLAAVERSITAYGCETFYVGDNGAFDRMAAAAVRECKAAYPAIRLYRVAAYLPVARRESDDAFDGVLFPEGLETVPPRYAIAWRNRHLADRADIIISYVQRRFGGAFTAVQQAARRDHVLLINLAKVAGWPEYSSHHI